MRSVYLFLAATAVVVTSKPKNYNNDIIWFPADDEDGVFISIYGEKFRTPQVTKTRSHRRARFSGPEPVGYPSFVQIPGENYDNSFFHNIHERREEAVPASVPKLPPAFQQQFSGSPFPNNPFLSHQHFERPQDYGRPQRFDRDQNFGTPQGFGGNQNFGNPQGFGGNQNFGNPQSFGGNQNFGRPQNFVALQNSGPQNFGNPQNFQNNGRPQNFETSGSDSQKDDKLQDLINEVFGVNGAPSNDGTPEYFNIAGTNKRPSKTPNLSGALIDNTRPSRGETPGDFNKRPSPVETLDYSDIFVNPPKDNADYSDEYIVNAGPNSNKKNQGNNNWGAPNLERPSENNWAPGPNRPNKPNKQKRPKPNRTTTEPVLIFPEESTRPPRRTTTAASTANTFPTEPTTLSPCERKCQVTPEYNPVCGSDSVTYTNAGRLKCAQYCGKDVVLSHYGQCGRGRLTVPLVSDNVKLTRRGHRKRL